MTVRVSPGWASNIAFMALEDNSCGICFPRPLAAPVCVAKGLRPPLLDDKVVLARVLVKEGPPCTCTRFALPRLLPWCTGELCACATPRLLRLGFVPRVICLSDRPVLVTRDCRLLTKPPFGDGAEVTACDVTGDLGELRDLGDLFGDGDLLALGSKKQVGEPAMFAGSIGAGLGIYITASREHLTTAPGKMIHPFVPRNQDGMRSRPHWEHAFLQKGGNTCMRRKGGLES